MATSQKLTASLWLSLLNRIDTILLDCDGVLWHGNDPINRAVDAVNHLKKIGKRVILVTNNSTKSRLTYVEKCRKLGFNVTEEIDIVTTSHVLADYLKNVVKLTGKVYVIGSRGIGNELDLVGIPHIGLGPDLYTNYTDGVMLSDMKLESGVNAVVVGFDDHLSYPKLMRAASYLKNADCKFIATNDDETFPSPHSHLVCPGTGCMVAAAAVGAGRQPVVLGKPNEPMFDFIRRSFRIDAGKTLMVGDRLRTDIQFARKNGLSSLLVLTGESSLTDLQKAEFAKMLPDFYTDSFDDILKF